MGSGAFLAIVVVLWFVVLVPMVLTRRDTAREAALPEPLSPAARILARRTAGGRTTAAGPPRRRFVAMTRSESSPSLDATTDVVTDDDGLDTGVYDVRAEELDDDVDTGVHARYVDDVEDEVPADPDAPRVVPDAAYHRRTEAARELMLARRRRTLIVLVALTVATLALAVLVSPWLWTLQVVVDVGLLAYLYHLRNEAIREEERREARELRSIHAARAARGSDRQIFTADEPVESAEQQRVVRLDDDDPSLYDLGDSVPLAHEVDLRGGPGASVSEIDVYETYETYDDSDDQDEDWDNRKAVGA